jgi:hypothetical protein
MVGVISGVEMVMSEHSPSWGRIGEDILIL